MKVKELNGGAIGATPTQTGKGRDAWNDVRRLAYKPRREVIPAQDDWGAGGPAPVLAIPGIERSYTRESQEVIFERFGPLGVRR